MEQIILVLKSIFHAKGIKLVLSSVLGGITWAIGGYTIAVHSLVVLMLIDFILGTGYAFFGKNGVPSKAKFQFGLKKRVLSIVAIMVGNLFDYMISGGMLQYGFRWFFTLYIGSDEVLSILGHLQKMGVSIPAKAMSKIREYRESLDGKIII